MPRDVRCLGPLLFHGVGIREAAQRNEVARRAGLPRRSRFTRLCIIVLQQHCKADAVASPMTPKT